MSPASTTPPFRVDEVYNEPALVGARWWQDQLLVAAPTDVNRRAVLRGAVFAAAGITVVTGIGIFAAFSDDDEVKESDSLAAQKQYGWSFGSETEPLQFGAAGGGSFDAAALKRLATELAPAQARYQPLYVATLFQSLAAQPAATPAAPVTPLASVLRSYNTQDMVTAQQRGQALASLFEGAPAGRAVIVDLPGPDAVAFAAGVAHRLEPVFLFDNWPHPRGVVPAHLTLAAAATKAPDLRQAAARRPANAPPAFILDRNRLAPYSDASDRFDNRYLARTPSLASLRALGINQLIYVLPTGELTESDDLVDDFVYYAEHGIDVKTVAGSDFRRDPAGGDAGYYYGGSPTTHYGFWFRYGWGTSTRPFRVPTNVSSGYAYRPARRLTIFTSTTRVGGVRGRPAGFGRVGAVVASGRGGRVTGARFGRSGSFGRGGRGGG
jgi:hypothetical protein